MVGEVAVLTLNRPQYRNALSVELLQALNDAVQRPGNDRAFLLTGAGGAFSAGADLAEGNVGGDFFKEFFALARELRTSALPVIAYVNGPAIGAGMMLTMACDLRVGATESYYLVPVAYMAIGVDEWVVGSPSSLVGASRARLMLLAGATLGAEEAAACGYVLTGGREDALELAAVTAPKASLTLRIIKAEFAADLLTPEQREAARLAPYSSTDIVEALNARREQRVPRFTGQ